MQIEIRTLQRAVGITTVFVTHDQEEALTLADRIAVMESGAIVQIGTPSEIYERPRSRFVSDFIGISNFLAGRVVERRGDLVSVEVGPFRLHAAGGDGLGARRSRGDRGAPREDPPLGRGARPSQRRARPDRERRLSRRRHLLLRPRVGATCAWSSWSRTRRRGRRAPATPSARPSTRGGRPAPPWLSHEAEPQRRPRRAQTSGLTSTSGRSPRSTRSISATTCMLTARLACTVTPATCCEQTRVGRLKIGLSTGLGSSLKTSSPAAPRRPEASASKTGALVVDGAAGGVDQDRPGFMRPRCAR